MSKDNNREQLEKLLIGANHLRDRYNRQLRYFIYGRIASFLFSAGFAIAALSGASVWWIPSVLFTVLFIVLVAFNEKLKSRQKLNLAYIESIDGELSASGGNYQCFDGGIDFSEPTHPFATDLDLFGENSVFQLVNRCTTHAGMSMLARWLLKPLHEKDEILRRQEAVDELSRQPEWRLRFRALGLVADEQKQDIENLLSWLHTKPEFNKPVFRLAITLTPILSIAAVIALSAGLISIQVFMIFLLLPLIITGFYTRLINARHAMLSRKVELLEKVAARFSMVEEADLKSSFFAGIASKLKTPGNKASDQISRLGRITASLDTRLNILAGLALNFLLLWDIRQMIRLEKWQQVHSTDFPVWFGVLADAEALSGLASFAFVNPDFIFPDIHGERLAIRATEAGHPLIPALARVANNISVNGEGRFNIITGANMAGKSTYLRTIGVNMVLALAGAPVCAKTFSCYPADIFTSLRTTDSLSANQSYFYAELLRLKEIIDRLNRGEALYVFLDEILKGTNSADKQAGSKALLTQLIGLNASGCIATHDLELGTLAKAFPENVVNYSFEADISGDELHFNYKLKPGIARNMNATFLMKKMGITL